MKYPSIVLLALCLAGGAFGAAASSAPPAGAPIFNGVFTVGAESRFVLITPEGKASQWIKLGDSFEGFALKAYDARESSLELERNGQTFRIALNGGRGIQAGSAGGGTPGTLAAANELLRVMRFEEMMSKILDQQQKSTAPMLQQPLEAAMNAMNLTAEERVAFQQFQQKAFGELFGSLNTPEMRAEMAKAYSENFTQEELSAQAAFYATPAGQAMVDKTPALNARVNEMMMPRMMAGMGKLQQSMQTFMREIAQKRAAAGKAPAAP